jgi:hypothetical protein
MVALGDSGFAPPVPAISYNFRCEAVTKSQIGTIDLKTFVEISIGVASDDFKKMAASHLDRWDLVQQLHESHTRGIQKYITIVGRYFDGPRLIVSVIVGSILLDTGPATSE